MVIGRIVEKLSLHGEALKTVIQEKRLELAGLRGDVACVASEFRLSERTACKLSGVERSSYRYEPRPDRNAAGQSHAATAESIAGD